MSRRFVITRITMNGNHPLICAVFEDHRMLEVQCIAEDAPPQILNNIYVGRVSQVVKNIGAAFVEVEKGRKCGKCHIKKSKFFKNGKIFACKD